METDQRLILNGHELLGLAHRKSSDKFLVQSCAVANEIAKRYDAKGTREEINALLRPIFNGLESSSQRTSSTFNHKLAVKFVVANEIKQPPRLPIESMNPKEMAAELVMLRENYGKLKAMNVDLMAQRDDLHNTVEYALKQGKCQAFVANPSDAVKLVTAVPRRVAPKPQTDTENSESNSSFVTLELL